MNSHQTLHIVRQISNQVTENLLSLITSSDSIVLIDDGCYYNNHSLLIQINNITENIYIIEDHAQARALKPLALLNNIKLEDLYTLVFQHKNSVTWQ